MAYIENIVPTTELEAVNVLLASIGEAPVTEVVADHPDITMALQVLINTTRELQSQGWKFNSEFDLQLSPDVEDFSWTEPDATTEDINIWYLPSGILSWKLSKVTEQTGDGHIDAVIRRAKQHQVSDLYPQVFYDRDYNRDGFPADERDYLWIDAVWAFDFTELPEVARRFITLVAARRFAAQSVGSVKLVGFTEKDEMIAYRAFMREQGMKDKRNLLNHPDTLNRLGQSRIPYFWTTSHANNGRA